MTQDDDLTNEDLQPVIDHLKQWHAPEPAHTDRQRLFAALLPHLPARKSALRRVYEWLPMQIMLSQLRVMRAEIWLGSALVMALGLLVTLVTYAGSTQPRDTLFVVLAPVVAAVGVAFLYSPDQALELEQALPVSFQMVLLARLVVIFGFNLLIGLAGSVLLAVTHADIQLWSLVTAWLLPMTFLSSLAFALSVLAVDPLAGMVGSMTLWVVQVFARMSTGNALFTALADALAFDRHIIWLLLAALIAGITLALAGREEHWIKGEA